MVILVTVPQLYSFVFQIESSSFLNFVKLSLEAGLKTKVQRCISMKDKSVLVKLKWYF